MKVKVDVEVIAYDEQIIDDTLNKLKDDRVLWVTTTSRDVALVKKTINKIRVDHKAWDISPERDFKGWSVVSADTNVLAGKSVDVVVLDRSVEYFDYNRIMELYLPLLVQSTSPRILIVVNIERLIAKHFSPLVTDETTISYYLRCF